MFPILYPASCIPASRHGLSPNDVGHAFLTPTVDEIGPDEVVQVFPV